MMNNVPSPSSDSLTPDDMYYLPFVFSVISVLGSSVVLLTFASARQLRTLLLRPVLLMVLFDFFTSIGNVIMFLPPIMGNFPLGVTHPIGCSWLAAVFGNMAQEASVLFYLCVVINLVLTMTRKSSEETTDNFQKRISRAVFLEQIFVAIYCFSSTIWLFIYGAFGAVNKDTERFECWIKYEYRWSRLFLYAPLMITMVVAACSLSYIWFTQSNKMMPAAWKYTSRRIMLFVVVFLVLWTVPTIVRMHELVSSNAWKASDGLLVVTKVGISLNGLVNAMVWTTSSSFLKVYRSKNCCYGLCKWWGSSKLHRRDNSEDSYLLDDSEREDEV